MSQIKLDEVFPNPTVKNVLFQIRFPNLFFIEHKLGEFQLEVMERFPESSSLVKQQFLFGHGGDKEKLQELVRDEKLEAGRIWKFSSPAGVSLELQLDSLTLNSESHKTYNSGTGEKLRDTIEYVLKAFFKIAQLPVVARVGLRYVDHCPIAERTNKSFLEYYNTTFDLERFPLDVTKELSFKAVVQRGKNRTVRYIESLKDDQVPPVLLLDFDASAYQVKFSEILSVTDDLHRIIFAEFASAIRQPVIDHMRKAPNGK